MLKLITTEQREVNKKKTEVRVYLNEQTHTEITTYLIRTDTAGNKWWAFEDLFALPFIRQLAAKKVSDLYGHGFTLDDLLQHTADFKTKLREQDKGEKYERCFAKVLELEQLAIATADPVKQCIGLCTLYVLLNDERPDAYMQSEQNKKMQILALDIDLQAFFLNWWTEVMTLSGRLLKGISAMSSMTSRQ